MRLLIVDDDPDQLYFLEKSFISVDGFDTYSATNGREALKIYKTAGPFDVVVSDFQMPHMDGFVATSRIRRSQSRTGGRIPIVAITANAMKGDRERCLASGMDEYISKPLDKDQLLAIIGKIANSMNGAAAVR